MLKNVSLIFLMIAALLGPSLPAGAQSPANYVIELPGLDGEVTIRIDEWGVPHIYATTTHDLVLAQGFMHAADRWWQMEWFRHQGAGRLSEIGGEALVETDIFLRTLGLPRYAQNDLDHAPPEVWDVLQAYADGVNAWLAGKAPGDVAVEYEFLNILRVASGGDAVTQIEPWTPLNSATWLHVMALALSGNAPNELMRQRIVAAAGAEALPVLVPGYDYERHPLIMEPGWIEPIGFPAAAGFAAVDPARALPGLENLARWRDAGLGSNNWVVRGDRTESGLPLLANDPHLSIMMPSIWYEVGLHCVALSDACPYNVAGFSFAGTPLVVIGHNEHIGWGVTNVGTDVQDLYMLEINPANPLQYRYEGAWRDMEVVTETITPWDGPPIEHEVRLTHFGPVVNELFETPEPVALRWASAEPNRNFESLMLLNKATTWEDFQAAVARFDLAAQNFVYADTANNIGYVMSGRVPLRVAGHDGTLPVDGTTAAYEWQGFVDPMENPRLFNPPVGSIVTANNAVLAPEDFPTVINLDWAYGYRAARIETLLQATGVHSPDTFAAIQFDGYNSAAALLVPALNRRDLGSEGLNEMAAWLAEWDYQNAADSPQAAVFNAFWAAFLPLVFDEVPFYEPSFSIYRLALMLDQPEHPAWANAELDTSDPTELMARALTEALRFLEDTYDVHPPAWRWGLLHVAHFRAAPLGQLPAGLDARLDQVLPYVTNLFNRSVRVGGSGESINATGWSVESGTFEVESLPSLRMILDLSDFDNTRVVHTTGQSGNPSSRHYADQMPLWAAGEYHAHYFSPAAVEVHTAETWRLTSEPLG